MMRSTARVALIVLILSFSSRVLAADARGVILDRFDSYDLVGLPEFHRSKEVHEFLQSLLRDPRMQQKRVRNIVVEFGNAKYQPIVDRFVADEEVAHDELQQVWRNTTQFLVWDSPLYEQFYQTIREVNKTRAADQRIRVILGDPPIGWEIVHTKSDYEQYADRDLFFAEVVEREVLSRNEKALLICGGMHLLNAREPDKDVPDKRRSAADLLHRRHPGKLFALWGVNTPLADGKRDRATAVVIRHTPRERESFAPFAPKGISIQKVVDGEKKWVPLTETDWPTLGEMTDGLIDYGPAHTGIDAAPETYRDASYVKEVRRRAAILHEVYGMDFAAQLDEVISK